MKKTQHISVEIDVSFGSGFQEDAALRALEKLMQAWTDFWHSKHSKTLIRYRITQVESLTDHSDDH